jgi:hypothetical protein
VKTILVGRFPDTMHFACGSTVHTRSTWYSTICETRTFLKDISKLIYHHKPAPFQSAIRPMAPFSGVPTHAQQVTLALAPKFAAALSITGSTYIVYDVLRIRKRKKASFQTFQRLMIGLSVFDILMSAGLFTSTWLMPSDTEFVWGARGTTATCSVIGFIEQAGVAAVMYNGSLSILYLLTIQYGWTSTRLQRSVEIWLHLVPILFAVSTMVAGIPLKLYNSGLFDCWIAPFPQSCQQSWRSNGETTCERGDNASLYQWGFDLIPKFSAIVVATVNMILIYIYVRKTELKSLATSLTVRSRGVSESDRIRRGAKLRMASKLAVQSYFYVGALYLTYVPVIITRITELTLGYVYYEMLLIISITIPLQGYVLLALSYATLSMYFPHNVKISLTFQLLEFSCVLASSMD